MSIQVTCFGSGRGMLVGRAVSAMARYAAGAMAVCTLTASLPAAPPASAPRHTSQPPVQQPRLKHERPIIKEALSPERAAALAAARAQAGPATAPQAAAAGKAAQPHAAGPLPITSVLFDQAADGTIWARGGNYKASFGSAGFTFIPRLGPDAPRNFPIEFVLEEVTLDGQALQLANAMPARDGNRVTFDRGAVVEAYDLRLESLEQTFILAAAPGAGAGDAVIRMSTTTDLAVTDGEGALVFAHDLGSVTYSHAIVVDAAGTRTPAATRVTDGRAIEITLPASLLATAAYPIVVDPIIQFNTVESGFDNRFPDTAYDASNDEYCVVFEEHFSASDGDIYSYRVAGGNGALIAGSLATIDGSGANWRRPKIANNSFINEYLVVAEVGFSPNRVINGRIRDAGLQTTGAQFVIGDPVNYPGDEVHADVGGDPYTGSRFVYYYVVWQNEYSSTDHDILARRIRPSNAVGATPIVEVDYSTNDDFAPAISKGNNAAEWTIVWQNNFAPDDQDIFAARVDWFGDITDATFAVDTRTVDHRNPRVSTPIPGGANMVVYEEVGDVFARVMSGTSIAAQAYLTDLDGVSAVTRLPVVDSSAAGQFVVAYEELFTDWDAYVSTFCYDGSNIISAEPHRQLGYTFDNDSNLMIAGKYASGGTGEFLIVWGELSGSFGDIIDAYYVAAGSCCPADTDDDGDVDVDDLVAVILAWGDCTNCAADVNGSTVVDVDDLIAVILGWGACS
jgi:hypothetical protein